MALKLALSEIVSRAAQLADDKERVKFLRENDSKPLRWILQYCLDQRAKWLLPEGTPEYKPNKDYPDLQGMLYSRARTLYLFVEGNSVAQQNLTDAKRQKLFRELLETIHPEDAKLLIMVKDKALWKTINKKVVNKAFPNLIQ